MTDKEVMEALLAGKRLLLLHGRVSSIRLDEQGVIRNDRGYKASLRLGFDGHCDRLEIDE